MHFKNTINMIPNLDVLPRLPDYVKIKENYTNLEYITNTQDIIDSENILQIKNWITEISKKPELIVYKLIRQNSGYNCDPNDYYHELFMINKNLKTIAKTKSDYINLINRLEQYTATYLINQNKYHASAWNLYQEIKSKISKL
jgi:hypothetical protein